VRLEWKLSWSKVSDPISLINDTHTQYNDEKGMLFDMVVDMVNVISSALFFILLSAYFIIHFIYILQEDIFYFIWQSLSFFHAFIMTS
jgi:hypothetical protein